MTGNNGNVILFPNESNVACAPRLFINQGPDYEWRITPGVEGVILRGASTSSLIEYDFAYTARVVHPAD